MVLLDLKIVSKSLVAVDCWGHVSSLVAFKDNRKREGGEKRGKLYTALSARFKKAVIPRATFDMFGAEGYR